MKLRLQTYTPLWTGGVAKNCDRLHETGVMGSMRFWYEVICNGLGIGACDAIKSDNRCLLDGSKYNEGIKNGKAVDEILAEQGICPVCRIFGCGGWKRRFQLRIINEPSVQVSFVSHCNKVWLEKIFEGNNAFFGNVNFEVVFFDDKAEFIKSQLLMLFGFIELFGALGAKMQHGFGQIQLLEPRGITEAEIITQMGNLRGSFLNIKSMSRLKNYSDYTLSNLVTIDCNIDDRSLRSFNNENRNTEKRYIPCAFDLKYKSGKFGLRKWLKEKKNWKVSSDAGKPKELDLLLGPRSQAVKNDDEKLAGRVFFSMPYKKDNEKSYRLRVFAFVPPDLYVNNMHICVKELAGILKEYLQEMFGDGINFAAERYGRNLIEKVAGGK